MAEALAVRWSDALIADAQGIADYYYAEFHAPTELIPYGAPILSDRSDQLAELGLTSRGYHLVVARFEPENHVDVIVDGYRRSAATLPLVVVGSAPYADQHTARIHSLADERVTFLGGLWDQDLLDQLYGNCATYLHGHSVGGTNPSLLRAIGAGAATIAYDATSTGRSWPTRAGSSTRRWTSPGRSNTRRRRRNGPGRAADVRRGLRCATTGRTSPRATGRCASAWPRVAHCRAGCGRPDAGMASTPTSQRLCGRTGLTSSNCPPSRRSCRNERRDDGSMIVLVTSCRPR